MSKGNGSTQASLLSGEWWQFAVPVYNSQTIKRAQNLVWNEFVVATQWRTTFARNWKHAKGSREEKTAMMMMMMIRRCAVLCYQEFCSITSAGLRCSWFSTSHSIRSFVAFLQMLRLIDTTPCNRLHCVYFEAFSIRKMYHQRWFFLK